MFQALMIFDLFKRFSPVIFGIIKKVMALIISGYVAIFSYGHITGRPVSKYLSTYNSTLIKIGKQSIVYGQKGYKYIDAHKKGFLPRLSLPNNLSMTDSKKEVKKGGE